MKPLSGHPGGYRRIRVLDAFSERTSPTNGCREKVTLGDKLVTLYAMQIRLPVRTGVMQAAKQAKKKE
jgi:hypothetical protein